MLREETFDILKTLGYPLYIGNQHIVKAGSEKQKVSVQTAHVVDMQTVKQRAHEITQKHKLTDTSQQQWPSFSLGITGFRHEVGVLFDLPDNALGKQVVPLIEKMLSRALVPCDGIVKKVFRWPLFPDRNIDQSAHIAKKALLAQLHRLRAEQSWKWLLVLGQAASEYTLGQIDKGQEQQYLGMRLISTLAIGDLLVQPELRQQAWQHIEPLRAYYARQLQ